MRRKAFRLPPWVFPTRLSAIERGLRSSVTHMFLILLPLILLSRCQRRYALHLRHSVVFFHLCHKHTCVHACTSMNHVSQLPRCPGLVRCGRLHLVRVRGAVITGHSITVLYLRYAGSTPFHKASVSTRRIRLRCLQLWPAAPLLHQNHASA